MKFPGYKMTCDAPGCTASEFFERTENHLDGDWWRIDGEDLCDECAHARENTRDEQAKLDRAESDAIYEEGIQYASAVRSIINGEG